MNSRFTEATEQDLDKLAGYVKQTQDIFLNQIDGKFCYPAFGTLLGVVREGNFIAGDTDADMMWHSLATTKEAVLQDVLRVYHRTHELGIFGYPHNRIGTMRLHPEPNLKLGDMREMDLCVSWQQNNEFWCNIFGNYHTRLNMEPVEAKLRKETILIPKDTEKFLELTYKSWKVPTGPNEDYLNPNIKWGDYLL